jgi:hypothetical protein
MIGKLSGIIDSFADNHAILDVNGVGYVVFASRRTLGRIGQPGDPATLLIDTHVREDHIHLYGFADANEQKWFRLAHKCAGRRRKSRALDFNGVSGGTSWRHHRLTGQSSHHLRRRSRARNSACVFLPN